MGSAASTGSNEITRPSDPSAGRDYKAVEKNGKDSLMIDESPLDSTPIFNTDPDDKLGVSNNKLKKMALGIQGYKEQQRDYDSTMNHLEMNHLSEVAWSEPKKDEKAHSPPKLKQNHPSSSGNMTHNNSNHAINTPGKVGMGSPNGSHHNMRPNNAPIHHPAPNHPPPNISDPSANAIKPDLGSHSFDHSSSFTKMANGPRGPPPGIPVRPFPKSVSSDDDGEPHQLPDHGHKNVSKSQVNAISPANSQKRIQNNGQGPPQLSLNHPQQIPQYGTVQPNMMTMQQMHNMYMSAPVVSSDSGKVTNVSAKGPPPRPMMMQQMPMATYNGPIGGAVPGTMNGPLPTSGPVPIGGGIMPNLGPRGPAPLPVVKETTVVKRNKVGLPSHMQHATPKTGDWLNKRYFVNNYILLDTLGTGSYGEVSFLCKYTFVKTEHNCTIL